MYSWAVAKQAKALQRCRGVTDASPVGMQPDVTRIRERIVELVDEILARYGNAPLHELPLFSGLTRSDAYALGDLVDALDRLDRGTYGLCVNCGGEIGRERLGENPAAALCAECADDDQWRPYNSH